jgi:hypothetical protein
MTPHIFLRFLDSSPGKKVWGPVWYGNTRMYGAERGQKFAEKKYPLYTDYRTAGDERVAFISPDTLNSVEHGGRARTLEMPNGYMEGFAKDFSAYFPKEDLVGEAVPWGDPIAAGYWPYTTADGYLAAGDPGATGSAARTFAAEDGKVDARGRSGRTVSSMEDNMDDVDKYLDEESSVYANDMRFYLDDDWLGGQVR